jgi:TRAP-type mannitol/chloroaromatic compound transport system substrate-binding protein
MFRSIKTKYFILVGLALVISLIAGACAPAAPTGEEVDCSDVEADLAASEKKVDDLEDEVSDLEKEIADLKKPAEVFEWRVQTAHAAAALAHTLFVDFTEKLEDISDGRVVITPFAGGDIVPVFETFDNIIAGTIEGDLTGSVYWSGKDPAFVLFSAVPGDPTEVWQQDAWYWEGGGIDLARELYGQYGIYYVAPMSLGAESIHFKEPVRTFADFEGVKIRTIAGITAEFFEKLGCSIVLLPGGEVYTALETGVIDAFEYGDPATNWPVGFHEITDYFVYPSAHAPNSIWNFDVGVDVWNELPTYLQHLVETTAREANANTWYTSHLATYEAIDKMIDYGNERIYWTPEMYAEQREMGLEIWDAWSEKSPMFAKVVKSKKNFMRDLGLID